ncbi:hypothetical protein D3C71_1612290 [compost metagenome]
MMFPQIVKIKTLNQLIAKLCERQARITIQASFHTVLSHHIIYGNVFPDIPDKSKQVHIFKPVIIVYHDRTITRVFKFQEFGELLFHTAKIMFYHILGLKIPFIRLTGRITNHSCCTTYQSIRLMSCTLKMNECHNLGQVANMQ